ncbi:UNVERIFIED_CONTAM: hypothetical protein GTU68_043705 [Idotea baltica]|nr:hypothetical protein [Idotea baltica]
MVFPSWCDSHTHIVYAGSREGEFVDRVKGLSYQEIAAKGGGILNSAKRLQATGEEALYQQAMIRVKEVIKLGTGAVEIKSGYGLTVDAELKILRVAKRIKETTPLTVKTTFLGAHAIPTEFKENRKAYLDLVCETMMPKIADEGLADYCDVFCEQGFFTAQETDRVLTAGNKFGMKAKVHANQLSSSGGIEMGVKNGAISVDHLEHVNDAEVELLRNSGTMPTLLPSASFFINVGYPPARKLIDAGLPVAIATDYNPGTTPSGNIPFLLSLSCLKMRMTPNEAINAATINSAYAMEVEQKLGSICIGKKANVFITNEIPSVEFLPYMFGSNLIETVILNGEIQ